MAPNQLTLTPDLQAIQDRVTSPAPASPALMTPAQAAPLLANSLGDYAPTPGSPLDVDQSADTQSPSASPAPGTFGQKLAVALDKTPLALKPNGQPQPGAWSRSLVGAAQGVLAGLGDIPTTKAPVGAGFISGIAGTIKNRNERLAAQRQQQFENERQTKKDNMEQQEHDLNMTHANIQFQHEQALWHKTQEIDPMVAQGQKAVSVLENSPKPSPIVARDLTSDELKQGVVDGKWNLHEFTPFATGTRTNPDGSVRATYTLVQAQGEVKLNDTDADTIKFINDNHGAEKDLTPNQNLTFDQFNHIYQTASNNAAATAARNKTLVDNKLATQKQAATLESVDFAGSGHWNNALVSANNDPLQALANLQARPEIAKQFPNLFQDVREAYGAENFDKLIEARQKRVEAADDSLTKLENDPDSIAGDKAPAAIAMAQTHLADPALPPAQKARWQRVGTQATQAQKITQQEKANQAKVEEAQKDGDPIAAGKLMATGVVAPSEMLSNRKPEFVVAANQAAELYAEQNGLPKWNAQAADGYFNAAKSPANVAFFGSAQSLLDTGGTLDQLKRQASTIPANKLPVLNKVEDWESIAAGNGPLSGYAATALGVADDYGKVMGGGTASDTARDSALALFSAAKSPDQLQQAINNVRASVQSQKKGRIGNNPVLQNMYGNFNTDAALNPAPMQKLAQRPAAPTAPAPQGATGEVRDKATGKLLGHVVGNKFVPISQQAGK